MAGGRAVDVIVCGDANADLLFDRVPQVELDKEKLAAGMDLMLGGSSSITAVNLSAEGLKVAIVGVVGDDLFGRFVEKRLRAGGVITSHLRRRIQGRTGVTVWMRRNGRRAGVTFPGVLEDLVPADVSAGLLARARHMHVGAYFLLTGLHNGLPALFSAARRAGVTTSLDTNWDPSERWDSGIREVLNETDVFLPNEDEAKRLTGETAVRGAARELARLARVVAVKRGARGALVRCGAEVVEFPAPRVRVVETTGAGDAFNAGFLARFVRGETLAECARAGVESGARAVTRAGGGAAIRG